MLSDSTQETSWRSTVASLYDIRVLRMGLLGFSAGLPILLIFSTLSLWLRDAGMARSAVTFFSWAALGYSFKFVWSPLVDRLPLPFLTSIVGRRRSWLLLSQFAVMFAIFFTGLWDPSNEAMIVYTAVGAVMIGFTSATQDIVIDAYRIEMAPMEMQPLLSAVYIAGYRIGMIAAGAGSLYLADFWQGSDGYVFDAWSKVYLCMSALMIVGILTTFFSPEPDKQEKDDKTFTATSDYVRFFVLFLLTVAAFIAVFSGSKEIISAFKTSITDLGMSKHVASFTAGSLRMLGSIALAGVAAYLLTLIGLCQWDHVETTYVAPVFDFFTRYAHVAIWILVLISTYRIADIVMGAIANVFYQDMGYTKTDIASFSKLWGLLATIAGGFLGGIFAVRFGVVRILVLGAILAAATNLLFVLLAVSETNLTLLASVITADNLSAGLASAAFVAYLSSLTNVQFTATQYALFSSIMTLFPKIMAGYSGSFVDSIGYSAFFTGTAVLGIPVLLVIWWIEKRQAA